MINDVGMVDGRCMICDVCLKLEERKLKKGDRRLKLEDPCCREFATRDF